MSRLPGVLLCLVWLWGVGTPRRYPPTSRGAPDAFLGRLRALWKSGEPRPPMQMTLPVRLGLVRFSARKPTALPEASSFPVLFPSTNASYRYLKRSQRRSDDDSTRPRDPLFPRSESSPTPYPSYGRRLDHSSRQYEDEDSDFQNIEARRRRADTEDRLYDDEEASLFQSFDARRRPDTRSRDAFNGTSLKRSRRRPDSSAQLHDVCPSVSDWVARAEALDPYGNRLRVLQRIPVNGTVVNQYFFETFCARSADPRYPRLGECRGINRDMWNSHCKENFIWTYGKVLTLSGDVGWSVIAIRGSCGCAIWRKPEDEDYDLSFEEAAEARARRRALARL